MRIASGLTALLVTGTVGGMVAGNEGSAAAERRETAHSAEPASTAGATARPGAGPRDAAGTGARDAAGAGARDAAGTGARDAAGTGARDAAGTGARDAALTSGEPRPGGPGRGRLEPYLEPSEITAEVKPYAPAIERCYLARVGEARRGGKLDVKLLIGHEGFIVSTRVAADGLSSRAARKVEGCIRDALAALRFPPRRNDTMAVVPYYFQRTEAPGAGPQLSCWSARGC